MRKFGKAENSSQPENVNIAWIREVSTRNLITQWNEIVLRFEEMLTGKVLYYPEQQVSLLSSVHLVKKEWNLIDRQLVSDAEALLMFSILNNEMPKLLTKIGEMKAQRSSMAANHEDNYLIIAEIVKNIVSDVVKLRSKVDAQKLSRYTDATKEEAHQHLASMSFPVYSTLPQELSAQLQSVSDLWEKLQLQVHTVEDEYLLERLVTDYIPNSVELYMAFSDANTAQQAEAKNLLSNQLRLMSERLTVVKENAMGQHLKAMRAQTEFLTERLTEGGTL